jgi:hypothetical protein
MSEKNVEAVRRGLEAWDADDLDAFLAELHPDVEWHPSLEPAFEGKATTIKGHDGVRRAWAEYRGEMFERLTIQVEQIRDLGVRASPQGHAGLRGLLRDRRRYQRPSGPRRAASRATSSTRRSWPATRPSNCRGSRRSLAASPPSTTGLRRSPARPSPTARSSTPRARRASSSTSRTRTFRPATTPRPCSRGSSPRASPGASIAIRRAGSRSPR